MISQQPRRATHNRTLVVGSFTTTSPEEVSERYPGVNQDLLRECRILVLAMITTWRWDRGDQLPNGRQLGTQWLSQIRAAPDRYRLDVRR